MAEGQNSPNVNSLLIILLIVAAFVIGSFWTKISYLEKTTNANLPSNNSPTSIPKANNPPAQPPVEVERLRKDDHVKGESSARILLIEYSDLECPFCKTFHATAQKAVNDYRGKLAWVYRHFPLDQLHSKARKEAEATECAFEQQGNDGFWKLTDKIFSVTPSNNGLDPATIPNLATEVGLDGVKLKACWDANKYTAKVENDYQSGIKAGVTGTPGNILLDTKTGKTTILPGTVPFDQLKSAVDSMLQ